MSRLCPRHLGPVVTDATWREPGREFSGWRWGRNQWERDSIAALIDRPPPTTFTDVARDVLRPAARFTARHSTAAARALWAGLRAFAATYRESLRVHP
ncbi:hypothetical protein [Sandarakinorhabdus sp.]|uniref:hypothetical protein n=1 Tax=Sandarakinorhabdus sp. TaxID=1916663 RepID=UPI00286EAEAB|nr:hypothetical protein [Sandarakinorhabdus sp.]